MKKNILIPVNNLNEYHHIKGFGYILSEEDFIIRLSLHFNDKKTTNLTKLQLVKRKRFEDGWEYLIRETRLEGIEIQWDDDPFDVYNYYEN